MKRTITLGLGALAMAGMALPASAADLGARPITKAPVAAPPPIFSWTGCYIGGNLGGKWSANDDFNVNVASVPVVLPSGAVVLFNNNGNSNNGAFIGGGQVGCQYQAGNWVFGIEGDFDGTNLKRNFVVQTNLAPFFFPGDAFQVKNEWQASVRGRLGYAWDRWMIYATGGVAFGQLEVTAALVGLPIFQVDKTLTGWTVGGGFEYAFYNNWSFGVEYRFSQFDNENFGFGTLVLPAAINGFVANASFDTHEVTARLNYRFNWFGGGAPY